MVSGVPFEVDVARQVHLLAWIGGFEATSVARQRVFEAWIPKGHARNPASRRNHQAGTFPRWTGRHW